MSFAQDTGDSIKNVPENYMPVGSDGQRGNSGTEKVGSSESSKGNGKKRLSDLERNIFVEPELM